MSLYGGSRDISLFRHLNRELINDIITQQIGYYKIELDKTQTDIYGEAPQKFYKDPVLINCLLERGDDTFENKDPGLTVSKALTVRLLRDDLLIYNVVPEVGDVILWEENYYEVDNVNENQLIVGKDPSYSYSESTTDFGSSWSYILTCHYARPGKFGITKDRL